MKKILLGALVLSGSLVATTCYAESTNNWVGGISYGNLSGEVYDKDISLGALVGSLGVSG